MRIIEGGVTALQGVVLMALFLWGDVFGYTLYIGGYIERMAASNPGHLIVLFRVHVESCTYLVEARGRPFSFRV